MKKQHMILIIVALLLNSCISRNSAKPADDKTYEVSIDKVIIEKDGKRIDGTIYKPESEEKHPVIIMSHGYNGSQADFYNEGRFFAKKGFIAYSFDFCGGSTRSRSSGVSTDMTIFSEKEDLIDVLEYFQTLEQVDTSKIFLLGGSQGGFVTALAADEKRDLVKGVVMYFPALGIPENWNSRYPNEEDIPKSMNFWGLQLGHVFFSSLRGFDTFDHIGKFSNEVLIIQGDSDQIVSMADSERAVKLYDNAKLVVLPGEGHGFTPQGSRKAMNMVLEFMKSNI